MPRAQRDLAELYRWIGAPSSDAARNWYYGLRKAIRSLRTNPQRCPPTQENAVLRHLLYGHSRHIYRVIYRVMESRKEVEVLHIRHGARDQFTHEGNGSTGAELIDPVPAQQFHTAQVTVFRSLLRVHPRRGIVPADGVNFSERHVRIGTGIIEPHGF